MSDAIYFLSTGTRDLEGHNKTEPTYSYNPGQLCHVGLLGQVDLGCSTCETPGGTTHLALVTPHHRKCGLPSLQAESEWLICDHANLLP